MLHELRSVMGLPGKPDGMTGAYYRDDHIPRIAKYCESDVLNTYRIWLRHELFRGSLPDAQFQVSEARLIEFVKARSNTKLPSVSLSARVAKPEILQKCSSR
jgi:hypothetical protein